ncbi:unnamed protein product [Ascophyllum nodosum]
MHQMRLFSIETRGIFLLRGFTLSHHSRSGTAKQTLRVCFVEGNEHEIDVKFVYSDYLCSPSHAASVQLRTPLAAAVTHAISLSVSNPTVPMLGFRVSSWSNKEIKKRPRIISSLFL